MPFVDQQRRFLLVTKGLRAAETPGDICFLVYLEITKAWKDKPRWTTIHYLRKSIGDSSGTGILDITDLPPEFDLEDVYIAELLAFDVFFALHGMEYEREKMKLNGDI